MGGATCGLVPRQCLSATIGLHDELAQARSAAEWWMRLVNCLLGGMGWGSPGPPSLGATTETATHQPRKALGTLDPALGRPRFVAGGQKLS